MESDKKIKFVAIYTRVSTREQAINGYSLVEQEERLNAYCKAKDWQAVKIYSDPGMSGAKLDRPGLQALIGDVNKHSFDAVLVWKLDRISRSQKDTLYLIEDVFLNNNISFISMNENFDTSTAYGRAMIGILSAFAQLERETIKERTALGREARAKSGLFHGGGFSALGYDYIDGKLIINDDAEIVRDIYKYYIDGYTLREISQYLKPYHNRHTGLQYPNKILNILKSPLYIGMIQHKGEIYQGQHEPIIDVETWDKVQQLVAQRGFTRAHDMSNPTALLNGIIYCAKCGARYCAHISGSGQYRYYYYICYSRNRSSANMIKDINCSNKNWRTDVLDNIVINEIYNICFDDDYFNSIARSDDGTAADAKKKVKAINRRISTLNAEISRLVDLCKKGSANFPIEIIAAEIEKNQNEIHELNAEIDKLENIIDVDYEPIKKALRAAVELFDNPDASLSEKVKVIRTLVQRIEIDTDTVNIFWTFGSKKVKISK